MLEFGPQKMWKIHRWWTPPPFWACFMHSKKQSDLHTVVRPSNTKTILKQVKVMHDKMESNQEKTSSF